MMPRRTTILKLCQRIASVQLHGVRKQASCNLGVLCNHELPSTATINWFGTFARNYDSMKIIPDKFDDKFFIDDIDDPLEDDFGESRPRHRSTDNSDDTFQSHRERPARRWTDEPPKFRDREPRDYNFGESRSENSEDFRSHRERPSRRWTNEPPRFRDRETTRDYNFHSRRRDNFQNRDYNQGSQWQRRTQYRSSQDPAGDESLDSFLEQFGEERRPRNSMEELWNQVREHKADYDEQAKIEKDFYEEHPNAADRPQEDIKKFMDTHQMSVTGSNSRRPIFQFEETGFPAGIIQALNTKFDQPTPIQSIGWPHALSGCDVVGIAQTGSGKTLSFILPAIVHMQKRRPVATGKGPIALVMCPTRELAMQCHDIVRQFARLGKIRSTVVYGGQSKYIQAERLMDPNLDIVVATPGRLLDFMSTDVISLRRCSFLVLDEADRMLDMGFEPQIRAIMEQIQPDRQVLMWSATWPVEIQDLASDFLKDYVHVKIGAQEHTVNKDIKQEFHYTTSPEKVNLLLDHLSNNPDPKNPRKPAKTLIFCATKSQCSRLQGILRREGFYSDVTHGDKSQRQRDTAMHNFRSGRSSILVASDVAARGIDVTDIEFVINYDLPTYIDGYIHRIGRTGRAGKKGTAISFITPDDLDMVKPIIDVLQDVDHEVPELLHGLQQKKNSMKSYRKMQRKRENNFNSGSSFRQPRFRY